jgi:acylglycerol lipase
MLDKKVRVKRGISACILLLLVACTPVQQPFQAVSAEPQKLSQFNESAFVARDGVSLPLRHWEAQTQQPKAVLLALHGFNDYSHAYALPAEWLQSRGVSVYAYDQRGFGASPKATRGIWAGAANLQRDARDVIAALRARYPDTPLYAIGESMGGAVLITACGNGQCPELSGIILSAPALWGDDVRSALAYGALFLSAHIIPSSQWTGDGLDILASDNLEILYAMGADPLIIKKTRVDAMYGLVLLMREAYASMQSLQKPVLLLYGKNDQLVPPAPVLGAIDRLRAPHNVAYYPEGYHLLLRDKQRERVFADIYSWIQNRYKPLPSGRDMGWRGAFLGVEAFAVDGD